MSQKLPFGPSLPQSALGFLHGVLMLALWLVLAFAGAALLGIARPEAPSAPRVASSLAAQNAAYEWRRR